MNKQPNSPESKITVLQTPCSAYTETALLSLRKSRDSCLPPWRPQQPPFIQEGDPTPAAHTFSHTDLTMLLNPLPLWPSRRIPPAAPVRTPAWNPPGSHSALSHVPSDQTSSWRSCVCLFLSHTCPAPFSPSWAVPNPCRAVLRSLIVACQSCPLQGRNFTQCLVTSVSTPTRYPQANK